MSVIDTRILTAEGTHWRLETAERVALLIDGAAYYAALAQAMELARHSIIILGWDIRSDLLLEPETSRETLAERFVRLLDATPGLRIRILIWDWIIAYSLDREILPQWRIAPLHERLDFVLDDNVPVGGAAHEKVVVIDGKLAFVGGIDLTAGRWDTPDHDPADPLRRPPDGGTAPPLFHDVTMAISGPAAASIGELALRRWQRATDQRPSLGPAPADAPWPDGLAADMTDRAVAIARIRPAYGGEPAVHEIRQLYLAAIAAAERLIYIENQYLTVPAVARALARKLERCPGLEVVVIAPQKCEGPLETAVMDEGRKRFLATLEAATGERLVVLVPISRGIAIKVHAKLLIVDDRFITLGSANLANRSMGVDSEINLAIEHEATEPVIRGWRQSLLAEHLGTTPERLAATEEKEASLIATIAALNSPDAERFCRPLQLDGEPLPPVLEELAEFADPPEPIIGDQILGPLLPLRERRSWRRWTGRIAGLAGVLAMASPWLAAGSATAVPSPWLAVPLGLALVAVWVVAERLWRPGLQ